MSRSRSCPLFVSTAFTAFTICLSAQAVSSQAAGIPATASTASQWGDAFNKGDMDAVVALYTDDAELLPHGTEAIRGHAAILSFLKGLHASRPSSVRITFDHVERFGGSDAASEVADLRIADGAGRVLVRGRQILILLKQKEEWKIHRDMWTHNQNP